MGLNSAVLNSVWVETASGFLGGLGVNTEFEVWMTFRKEGPGRITVRDGVALEEAFLLGAEWLPLSTSHHALRSHTGTLQVCLLRGYPSLPKPGAQYARSRPFVGSPRRSRLERRQGQCSGFAFGPVPSLRHTNTLSPRLQPSHSQHTHWDLKGL